MIDSSLSNTKYDENILVDSVFHGYLFFLYAMFCFFIGETYQSQIGLLDDSDLQDITLNEVKGSPGCNPMIFFDLETTGLGKYFFKDCFHPTNRILVLLS